MGSYNMSCALTGMSIGYGDPAVVVLARSATQWFNYLDKKEPDDSFQLKPGTYFYDSDTALSAVVPAVKGTYDDYGHLVWDLDENPALREFAEQYSIDSLIEPYGHGCEDTEEKVKRTKERWPNGLFAIWIRREAWDAVLEYANSPQWYHSWFPDTALLSHLGFEKQKESTGFKRYTQLWTHPEWPDDYAMACDGGFGQFAIKKDGEWTEDYICTYPDIAKKAKKYGLPLKTLDWDGTSPTILSLRQAVARAAKHSYRLFETKEELDEAIATYEAEGKQDMVDLLKQMEATPKYSGDCWGFICGARHGEKEFCELWAQKLVDRDPAVEAMCAEMYHVKTFFYLAGRLFIPTHGGPQCGDAHASKVLANVLLEMAKTRLDEYEDHWDEDWDEDEE